MVLLYLIIAQRLIYTLLVTKIFCYPNDITVRWLPITPIYDTINVGKGSTKQLGMSLMGTILLSNTPANILVEDAGLCDLLNNTPLNDIITNFIRIS